MHEIPRPDIEALRRAAALADELNAWAEKQFPPEAVARLGAGCRQLSGLGRELWRVRVWAIYTAGVSAAEALEIPDTHAVASALAWMAQHGYGGGWTNPGEGSPRAVPIDYLDRVHARACAVTEAAGAPYLPPGPLARRNALGGEVWTAAFAAATDQNAVDHGIALLEACSAMRNFANEYRRHATIARQLRQRQALAAEWRARKRDDPRPQQERRAFVIRCFPRMTGLLESADEQTPEIECLTSYLPYEEASEEATRWEAEFERDWAREYGQARAELGLPTQP